MLKQLVALTAVTAAVAAPAVAGTAHDFNADLVTRRQSLDGQCYSTQGDARVCFVRLTGESFAVSVREDNQNYSQVFTVNCDTGRYKGYGPRSQHQASSMAHHFCDNGRY